MASTPVPQSAALSQIGDERPWACDDPGCTMAFRREWDLNRHKKTHIDRNSPEFYRTVLHCPHFVDGEPCLHTTFRKLDMEVHVRTHTGERPFGCRGNGCESTFMSQSARRKHERRHHGIMHAERGARTKPAQTIASASATETKDESKMNRSNRFTPDPIPSSSALIPSAPSTSTSPISSVPLVPTASIPSASSTSFGSETSTSLLSPGLSMFPNGAVEGLFTGLTIPPFNDTTAYPSNVDYGQGTWQEQQSFAPIHSGPTPFYTPTYPVTQPSIMPQNFWPQADIPSAPTYPQLDNAYEGPLSLDSMPYTSVICHENQSTTPPAANDSEKLHLSQEDLDALSAYYSSLLPYYAPLSLIFDSQLP